MGMTNGNHRSLNNETDLGHSSRKTHVEKYDTLEEMLLEESHKEEKNNSTLRTPEGWNSKVYRSCWLLDRRESSILAPVLFVGLGFEGIGDN
jgi:hypothetical protein